MMYVSYVSPQTPTQLLHCYLYTAHTHYACARSEIDLSVEMKLMRTVDAQKIDRDGIIGCIGIRVCM